MSQCKGVDGEGHKSDGSPCESPYVDPDTGYCVSHGPGAAVRMRERGRRGAEATAAKHRGKGTVDPDEAPDAPETVEDAKNLASWATRAVMTGVLDPKVGRVVKDLLKEFREAAKVADMEARLKLLESKLATAERAGK